MSGTDWCMLGYLMLSHVACTLCGVMIGLTLLDAAKNDGDKPGTKEESHE